MSDFPRALAELPLFPLHHAVLFPGTLLPLHVFEPRYRRLVSDVLAGHRTLCIPQIIDPEADVLGRPAIASIAGAGTIVEHMELPGGRYNIVVLGRARVQLQELHFVEPYRRALGTTIEDSGEVPPVETAALHAAANAFAAFVRSRDKSFTLRIPKEATAGALADAYAHQLIVSPRERQAVLEALDVRARVRLVTEVLTVQRANLAPQGGGELN